MKKYLNLHAIKKNVKEITNQCSLKEPPKMTDKAEKIAKILPTLGYSSHVLRKMAEIFSIATGEEIIVKHFRDPFPIGTMIVPLYNKNSHNYTINEPCLIDAPGRGSGALRMNGTPGNSLEMTTKSIRFATDEEIDYYFDEFNYITGSTYLFNFIKYLHNI